MVLIIAKFKGFLGSLLVEIYMSIIGWIDKNISTAEY